MPDSNTPGFVKGQFYSVPLAELHADANQPRKYMDPQALEELSASISKHGVLEPILFRQDAGGALYVVAGERRAAAAQKAGLTHVPGILVDGNHAEIALIENLLRENLTAVEEAEALDRIMKDHGYKQEDLCGIIGKAKSTLSEILSLNRLPKEVRDECRNDPTASKNILIEIAKKKQARSMLSAYRKYKEQKLSKEQLKKQRQAKKPVPEVLLYNINELIRRTEKIDVVALTEADKERLLQTLSALIKTFAEKIGPVAA